MTGLPSVAVVVPAFGFEPLLGRVVAAILASVDVTVELAIVDNGFECPDLAEWADDPRITWLRPGHNTGFTGGCNLGAAATTAPVIAFVNSDAVVAPNALRRLVDALSIPGTGLVTGCVVLDATPDIVNAAGNPVHYSMLSWAGGWGDPVAQHRAPTTPASISGALFAVERSWWTELGGFHEALFAYGEDVELSVRSALAGLSVRYVPEAVARHHYEFHRNPGKFYLLERNRLINLATLYEPATLVALAPGLLAIELGILVASIRGGWWREKLRGYRWLAEHRTEIRARRRQVQAHRQVPDAAVVGRLELALTPSEQSGATVPPVVNRVIAALGRLGIRRIVGRSRRLRGGKSRETSRIH